MAAAEDTGEWTLQNEDEKYKKMIEKRRKYRNDKTKARELFTELEEYRAFMRVKEQHYDSVRDMESSSIDEEELTKHKDTLAIGIFAHGQIIIKQDGTPLENNNFPIGVHIKKKNVATFACVALNSYNVTDTLEPETRYSDYKKITKKIIYSKEINIPSYYTTYTRDLPCSKLYRGCYGQLFDGKTNYYEKTYGLTDPKPYVVRAIILSTHDNEIDIAKCTIYELCSFFKINYPFILEEGFSPEVFKTYLKILIPEKQKELIIFIKSVMSKLLLIIQSSEKKRLNTTHIFDLIAIARDHLGITKTNILDASCNVVQKIKRDGLSAEEIQSDLDDTCDGYSISGNCVTPPDHFAWGGKTKRKRKRTNRRQTKRPK